MPRLPIDSLHDPRIEPFRHVARTNLTRWSGRFIAEGKRVVRRLVESGFAVESVLVSDRREAEVAPWLPAGVPLYVVPHRLAQELVGFNFHTGVLACGLRKPSPDLAEILQTAASPLTLVACPNVDDPENLGTIIRSAAAFGVAGLLLGRGCADPFSRRVLRVSMGNAFRLPIVESDDLRRDLERLRTEWSVELAATVLDDDAEPLDTARRTERLCLLFGHEAHGLGREWTELCDRRLTVLDAAKDASREIRLVEARRQAKDHPVLGAMPETQYLKCLILQVY
jgi:tRNA G18 (ribose-2'-O)-methylase SpoU